MLEDRHAPLLVPGLLVLAIATSEVLGLSWLVPIIIPVLTKYVIIINITL